MSVWAISDNWLGTYDTWHRSVTSDMLHLKDDTKHDTLLGFVDLLIFLTHSRWQAPITVKATARATDQINSQVTCVTCNVRFQMSDVRCHIHLSDVRSYMLHVRKLNIKSYRLAPWSVVKCHLIGVRCHISGVKLQCYVPCFPCHVAPVTCFLF